MSKMFLVRRGLRLEPANLESQEALERIPERKMVEADVKQTRNAAHNALYWSCLSRIADWLDQTNVTADVLHDLTKMKCGICTLVMLRNGDVAQIPGSTAFHKMDQTAFSQYFEKAVAFWYGELQVPPKLVADLLTPQLVGVEAA